jgi:iron-sulfur cluster assembly accessory protein
MTSPALTATLTSGAVARLKELRGADPEPILHLYVAGRTCCGVRYGLILTDHIQDGYTVVDADGVHLVIDPASRAYCEDTVVDFVETPQGAGFTVRGPGNTGDCRCRH